jgi:hypothetical protein
VVPEAVSRQRLIVEARVASKAGHMKFVANHLYLVLFFSEQLVSLS